MVDLLRLSFGADGKVRRTVRAPGLGLYDTKTLGGGQSPQPVQQVRKGNPLLALFGIAVVIGLIWTACGGSDKSTNSTTGSQKVSAAATAAAWTAAPVDGTWSSSPPTRRVPFGTQSTPLPAFPDYAFVINAAPRLTTEDNGKTATMTSTVVVKKIASTAQPDKTITATSQFLFYPGETAPENQYDESHGVGTKVNCQKDTLAVGESTNCTASFNAPAGEIQNSYWEINGMPMGTWPSQT